jgi:hypothetical protein
MNRKYWLVLSGPNRRYRNNFKTRQAAVEFANNYYEEKSEILEVEERILRVGRKEPQWHK